ncbi:MAG: CinA family nicotinamide mononucleotide deamidase-related protein, partial [Verrucomicrobiota bacterium]
TGGLGPTSDDMTREALAEALGLRLVHSEEVETALRARFLRMGREMTDNNLRQCQIFAGSEAIRNDFGTAPGIFLKKDGKILIMLPGPTHELKPMFERRVLPRLEEEGLATAKEAFLQLRTCGIGESLLDQMMEPIIEENEDLGVAYCAHQGLVDLRLSAGAPSMTPERVRLIGEQAAKMLGEDFVGFGDITLAQIIYDTLRKHEKTLAVAESCTGGLLSNAFTDVPGSSKVFDGSVVCYTNDAKVQMLDVPECILRQHGAVSAESALAMATGAAERFSSDYGLSVTGFAGPGGGTTENPVGTIFIGYYSPAGAWSRRFVYPGERLAVKQRAVNTALDFMRRKLVKYRVEDFIASLRQ